MINNENVFVASSINIVVMYLILSKFTLFRPFLCDTQVKESTFCDFSGQMHCDRNAMDCHGRPSPIYQRSSRLEFQIQNHQSLHSISNGLKFTHRILKFKRTSFVLLICFVYRRGFLVSICANQNLTQCYVS